MKKPTLIIFAIFALFIMQQGNARSVEDANVITKKADSVRVPDGSYQFDATIINYEGTNQKDKSDYRVYVQNLDRSLVEFTAPAKEKGKSLLMLDEDLWIYLPKIKKPIRIPLQQRLMGNVSNGDMARVNFADDYNAKLAGEEKVNGKDAYVLELTAKSSKKTYNKIKYWVQKGNYYPVKAEYFTVSGKSLKVATFGDFKNVAGALRPMQVVYVDSLDPNKKSVLNMENMIKKTLASNMFSKTYMKTLE